MSLTREEAFVALQSKSHAERELAELPLCPPLRHAAFAGVMALLVASPALPVPLRVAAVAVALVSIALIVQWDKRRLGVFINGYRQGKTRMVAIPLVVISMALYFASVYFAQVRGQIRIALALAAITFVLAYVGSTIWQRVFRRELGA